MIRRRLPGLLAALALTPVLGLGAAQAQPAAPAFAVGQVWSVKAEPPTTARVIIDRIEDFNGRTAVHVTVTDVPTPPGLPLPHPTMTLGHLPFDAEALRASLDKLVGTTEPPAQFQLGYDQWKAAKGGVFTVSVPQVIEIVFKSVPKAP